MYPPRSRRRAPRIVHKNIFKVASYIHRIDYNHSLRILARIQSSPYRKRSSIKDHENDLPPQATTLYYVIIPIHCGGSWVGRLASH